MSDSDFSGRLPGPVTGRPRRPLSNSASTASCSMRFSLLTMISGAPRLSRRPRRLLRLITRRYRSLRSDVAKRPPSSWTIGRSSGGITGTTSRIIALGSLIRRPCSSRRLNEATIFRRLMAFCLRWADSGLRPDSPGSMASRSLISSSSKSMRSISCLIASAPGATLEVVAVLVAQLAPQHLVVDDLARVEVLELVPRAGDEVELDLVALAQGLDVLVGVAAQLLGVAALGLDALGLVLELLVAAVDRQLELLLDRVALLEVLVLQVLQVLVALVLVDPRDEVGGEVDDLLELLGLELLLRLDAGEEVGQPRPGAAQVPDVHDGGLELDVAHAVTADLGPRDLDAAALADDALEAHPLVLAAVALPVPGRAEDLLAEEAVLLRTQRAVVDRLGLLHLAVRPDPDLVGGGQPDLELVEHVHIEHWFLLRVSCRRGGCEWVPQYARTGRGGRSASSSSEPRSGREMSMPSSSAARKTSSSSSRISISEPSSARTSTLMQRACISFMRTLKLSGTPGLGDVVALDDRLVDLDPAEHVVGLDGQQLLQAVGGAVGLEGPHLHLAEALAAELRLAAQRLLGDHRVRAGRAGVDLVVHEVGQLEDVHEADGDLVVVRVAGAPVVQHRLAVVADQAVAVDRLRVEVVEDLLDRRVLAGVVGLVPVGAVEHRAWR